MHCEPPWCGGIAATPTGLARIISVVKVKLNDQSEVYGRKPRIPPDISHLRLKCRGSARSLFWTGNKCAGRSASGPPPIPRSDAVP
ncbi:Hypothetical Protein RSKD131_2578 [Cereibacter sphaeroides KD131]|nr:Hypothetical Protein RSKD131_2578 [Cereibacter sphaeroides KD131]